MKRIPCIILCYYDFRAVKESLTFFSKYKDRLELIVVENPSTHSDKIKPFINNLMFNKEIDYYIEMDENIGLNAVQILLDENIADWRSSKYIINAEGDIVNTDKTTDSWIDEELLIMDNHPEVGACGLAIDNEFLKTIDPRGAYWYPPSNDDRGDYYAELTGGGHAVMWRTEEMQAFLNFLTTNNLKFVDNHMHPFCRDNLRKVWARTKRNQMHHLSWEYQLTPNHEYHNLKVGKEWTELFHHNRYCGYTLSHTDTYFFSEEIPLALNIGCGDNYLSGWINIDIDSKKADKNIDLRGPLPYQDNSISYIYNEHFIEHLTSNEAISFLKECYRVLKPGGVIRTATFDLDILIDVCNSSNKDWRHELRLAEIGLHHVTKCELFNLSFYEWGHKFIYNEEELLIKNKQAGFTNLQRQLHSSSNYAYLRNKETRFLSNLIIEAVK